MKSYTILRDGHQTLKQVALPVEKFDMKLKEMTVRMLATMRGANGIGLAANQVGILKRVLVMDTRPVFPNGMGEFGVFINPEIIESSEEQFSDIEGCLSFPNKHYRVLRNSWVVVKWQDTSGKAYEKKFTGLSAVCLQHEIDHLNGITFDTKGK